MGTQHIEYLLMCAGLFQRRMKFYTEVIYAGNKEIQEIKKSITGRIW